MACFVPKSGGGIRGEYELIKEYTTDNNYYLFYPSNVTDADLDKCLEYPFLMIVSEKTGSDDRQTHQSIILSKYFVDCVKNAQQRPNGACIAGLNLYASYPLVVYSAGRTIFMCGAGIKYLRIYGIK